MEYKITVFVFQRPLTKAQEDLFIGTFQDISEGVRKRLEKSKKAIRSPFTRFANKQALDMMEQGLDLILGHYNTFIRLEKETDHSYRFMIAHKAFAGLDVKVLGFGVDYWKRLQDAFVDGFRKHICREMGFSPNEVEISFEEADLKDDNEKA